MLIIVSPAKRMNVNTDEFACRNLPEFLSKTERIYQELRGMSYEGLKDLWKCNDKIAEQNVLRLEQMDLYNGLTPALIAYEGIQYQYMAPKVFSEKEYDYLEEHLRILSGFYGLLRPFDGVTPYRLEMQAKISVSGMKDLYEYWGDLLAKNLFSQTDRIINLASKEYSKCISKYLPGNIAFITCVFGEEKDGKIIEKGTMCKMARGEMVRYMAENQIKDAEEIKEFSRLSYHYSKEYSDDNTYVYVIKKQ